MKELALAEIYSVLVHVYACAFLVAIYWEMYNGDFLKEFRE
jgi:hypothetical protein